VLGLIGGQLPAIKLRYRPVPSADDTGPAVCVGYALRKLNDSHLIFAAFFESTLTLFIRKGARELNSAVSFENPSILTSRSRVKTIPGFSHT
jgi:hypothetical protein